MTKIILPLLILLLSSCAVPRVYQMDHLKVTYKPSVYTRGLDINTIGMKVNRVWYEVKDCMGVDPGDYRMVVNVTDDIFENYPGYDGITITSKLLPFSYTEVKTIDLVSDMYITRHELVHTFAFLRGDPDFMEENTTALKQCGGE